MRYQKTIKMFIGILFGVALIACSDAEDNGAKKESKADHPAQLASSIKEDTSKMQEVSKNEHVAETSTQEHALHWSYTGDGAPYYWGGLKEEYATCGSGKRQSPIDISSVTVSSLPAIDVDYKDTPLDIVNNGHSIQVNYAQGSSITVGGKRYNLLQFHFHAPSEHTMGGKSYPMVMHLVHKADDGQLAVIGVMIRAGNENHMINKIWQHIPATAGESVTVADVSVNAIGLLPRDPTYFDYSGSLTTPPCSEGVHWMFMAAPIDFARGQIEKFTAIYTGNNRPVQPLNGRVVRLSN